MEFDATYAVRCLFGLGFAAGGISKAVWFSRFYDALAGYRLIPRHILPHVGITIFFLEIAIGAALLIDFNRAWTTRITMGMLAGFTGAVAWAVYRDKRGAPCGCLLLKDSRLGPLILIRNVWIAAILWVSFDLSAIMRTVQLALAAMCVVGAVESIMAIKALNKKKKACSGCAQTPVVATKAAAAN